MLQIQVLGPLQARIDDRPVRIGSAAQRVVLAALSRVPGQVVSLDRLSALVWSGDPPRDPRGSMKSHVSRLRRTLEHDVVAYRESGYVLTLDPVQLDSHRFTSILDEATTLAGLDAGLSLWRGTPFGELADDPWFASEVARLEELHTIGMRRRAELLLAAGRHDEAASALAGLAADHPLREPVWIALVASLHAAGRQAHAVAAARRHREFVRQAGLEPSSAFERVVHEAFTTPAASDAPRGRPASAIPARVASIVGRDDEMRRVGGHLASRRVVTLVGPGGVGKTTVALEAARRHADRFTDGACVAWLADVEDGDSVVAAIARAVGAPMTHPLPESLASYLSGRTSLLVLDNAEHLRAEVARLVQDLASACHDVVVMVTSRRSLGVTGEVVVPVEPLEAAAALELLRDRAADVGIEIPEELEDVAMVLCDRLDRLPLAVEMAARRLPGMGLVTLAARLEDRLDVLRGREGRHRTLEEVVTWSYDLLNSAQQSALRQVSVFAGPVMLEAAERVIDVDGDVAVLLADLAEQSLITSTPAEGGPPFTVLETVRGFASRELAATGQRPVVVRRFVDHHADLATGIGLDLQGRDEPEATARFDAQTANVEAALRLALDAGDVDAAARLTAPMHRMVYLRMRADVGAWAESAWRLVGRSQHRLVPAVAAVVAIHRLHGGNARGARSVLRHLPDEPVSRFGEEVLGDLHLYRGDLDTAAHHFARATMMARRVGDDFTRLFGLASQALAIGYAGDRERARELLDRHRIEAAATSPFLGSWWDYAQGELLVEDEPERALDLVDAAVSAADAAGWDFLSGVGRVTASSLRARHGDPAEAVPAFRQLVLHWRDRDDRTHQWTTLANLVELLVRMGAHRPATRLLAAVRAGPATSFGAEAHRLEVAGDDIRAVLGEDVFEQEAEAGRSLDHDAAVSLAMDVLTR